MEKQLCIFTNSKKADSSEEENFVEIFVDGCSLGNPGPSGWACIIRENGKEVILTEGEPFATNNQMELKAVLFALSYFKIPKKIKIYSDSEYVIKGITEWLPLWKKRGFKTKDGKPIKNRELWEEIEKWINFHREVIFEKVPAHSGILLNEKADRIAKKSAEKWKKKK